MRYALIATVAVTIVQTLAYLQTPAPSPTHTDLEYAPPEPATSNGHKLDRYIAAAASGALPVEPVDAR